MWDGYFQLNPIRLLLKFALPEKNEDFRADLRTNFEEICEHITEKFKRKDAEKSIFSGQMEF